MPSAWTPISIGAALAMLRTQSKLDRDEIAARAGISVRSLARYENDGRIDARVLHALVVVYAEALDRDRLDIWCGFEEILHAERLAAIAGDESTASTPLPATIDPESFHAGVRAAAAAMEEAADVVEKHGEERPAAPRSSA